LVVGEKKREREKREKRKEENDSRKAGGWKVFQSKAILFVTDDSWMCSTNPGDMKGMLSNWAILIITL
jgi:hypothetical protein